MFNPYKRYASLEYTYHQARKYFLLLAVVSTLMLAAGLVWSLYIAPPDYQQGEAYRLIFVHVPSAWMSLFVYVIMAGAGAVALIWRVKIAEIVCVESARPGAAFTALALLTGMLWGKPMWGTYWVWDARLTSELILFFLYLGVIALHSAIPEPRKAARAAAILAIIGVINIPIIHYSVVWWHTLHQAATVTRFDTPAAHPSMLYPLLYMSFVFFLFYKTAMLARMRLAIGRYAVEATWWRQLHKLPSSGGN